MNPIPFGYFSPLGNTTFVEPTPTQCPLPSSARIGLSQDHMPLRPRFSKRELADLDGHLRNIGTLAPRQGKLRTQLMPMLPGVTNNTPAGKAAKLFQAQWQKSVLKAPGSIRVTREQLGFKSDDIAMLDIGGEGQKTAQKESGGSPLKSGCANAINVNAATMISSTPLEITIEPDGPVNAILRGHIPNLVRPAASWKGPFGMPIKLPFSDNFSNLTVMEGAPLSREQAAELHRITDARGWIVLSVHSRFEQGVAALASLHNGGKRWVFNSADNDANSFPRIVLPPRGLSPEQLWAYAPRFDQISTHELFDVVQRINFECSDFAASELASEI